MKTQVSIAKYPDLEEAINLIGGLGKYVKPGDRVFVKPNACVPKTNSTGTVSSPELIFRVLRLLKNITDNIAVGDSPFAVFRDIKNLKVSGIVEAAEKARVEVVNLNRSERVKKGSFYIAKPVVDADVLINVPVMKTHERTGVTLSLKNIMGVVPANLKHEMHKQGLEERIVDLNKSVKPSLIIMDANVCQEGGGPVNGTPKKMGLIIVGTNPVAVDSVCCKIMGIAPRSIKHLVLAEKEKIGSMDDIDILGFKEEYISKFDMPKTYNSNLVKFCVENAEAPIQKFIERYNKINFNWDKCSKCGLCVKSCPEKIIKLNDKGPVCNHEKCILCLCCYETCLENAISIKESFYRRSIINLIRKILSSKAKDNEYIRT